MSNVILGPTLSCEEFSQELRKRKQTEIYKTVTASTKGIIEQKVLLEEYEGWYIARRNKQSVRMAKKKPYDEQFEDEVWSILAQMGFKEMSLGRNFQISVGENVPPRQIDVFAKDDEVGLIVECTRRDTLGRKSMNSLISKIATAKAPIQKAMFKHYGRPQTPKFRYVIATRNIQWSQSDINRCREQNIAIISDGEIDYYAALVRHLKHAARFQLLGHIFEEIRIKGLAQKVVATRSVMGGDTCYMFSISPNDLLKIAYVGHKSSREIDNIKTYQRMLQPHRLKRIAKFINDGGKFPTNIVVNLKTKRNSRLKFEGIEKLDDQALGYLYLPQQYASAWIIDGQHRLYGYAYRMLNTAYNQDKTKIPVLAYENLSADKERELFIDINSKQVRVSTSLLAELYDELHWASSEPEKAFRALLSRLTSRLNSEHASPLCNRVVVTGKKKTAFRCLTQTSLNDGLRIAKLVGSIGQRSVVIPGPLSTEDPNAHDQNLEKAFSIITRCLGLFSTKLADHWRLGDGPGGYLCTNNGLRAIFHVISDISDHIRNRYGTELCHQDADQVVGFISPYLDALGEYFKSAPSLEIDRVRRIGSSLMAVKTQSLELEDQINRRKADFNPTALKEYRNRKNKMNESTASIKIRKIHRLLSEYVLTVLRKRFGTDDKRWWTEGIPLEIRLDCTKKWEESQRQGSEESHLNLINYVRICTKNWELVKNVISLDAKNKTNRTKNADWIRQLNNVRNIVAHPERGTLTPEQIALVDDIETKVQKYFPESEVAS